MANVSASQATQFFKDHAKAAIETSGGIFPSVKLAMAAAESAFGTSDIYKSTNNFFGIKLDGYPVHKDFVTFPSDTTRGQYIKYRKYDSDYNSFKDHTDFLKSNSRYASAGVFTAKTPEEQLDAIIIKGKYAEGTWEAQTGKQLISLYNLKQYDTDIRQYRLQDEEQKLASAAIEVSLLFGLLLIGIILYIRLRR